MTALTVPALPREDANLRPVPWRRMAWVTWRQHRTALAGVTVFLGALAVWLWLAGLQLHRAAAACHQQINTAVCDDRITHISFWNHLLAGGYVLQPVPVLLGAFIGAPLLARELETGTFRFAWTQGLSRWRWTLAKLVGLALVVVAAATALSVLISWYYQPYLATGTHALQGAEVSPLSPALFDLSGIDFALWTLTAIGIGAFAGTLIRRVVPAIVTTLVAYTAIALAAGNVLLQHYLTPLLSTNPTVPQSAWIIRQWWTKNGTFAFSGLRDAPHNLLRTLCSPAAIAAQQAKAPVPSLDSCLANHGYTHWTKYQPASRFWTFQWIQGGWLLALSILLIATTVWLVHRRAAR